MECRVVFIAHKVAASRASLQTSAVCNVSVCLVSKNSNSKTEQLIKGLVSV